jgi:hypothetical protein
MRAGVRGETNLTALATAPDRLERRLPRLDRRALWLGAVALALAWSAVPVIWLAIHTIVHGGVLSGSDGPLAGADQLFYMDSIRQSGAHGLIADHFDLVIGHAVFLNPLFLLAGLLWRAGLPLQAVFWALKLLAAPALALGAVGLASRVLSSGGARASAVVVGLFYFSPVLPLLAWTGAIGASARYQLLLPVGEGMPAWQLWGYSHAALTIGLEVGALLGALALAENRVAVERRRALLIATSAAACLVAWFHPWQGATLILVLAALAAYGRSRRLAFVLLAPVAAAAGPLIYEAILPHVDAAWHVDSVRNAVGQGPLWTLLVALVPLAVPAAFGVRAMPRGPLKVVLVAWPVAALVVYFGTSQFPYHALQGISLPLAVLAVAGWQQLRAPRAAALGLLLAAVVTVPGAVYEVRTFRDSERAHVAPYWFSAGERAALRYLEANPTPGGVIARQYLGTAVPAFTGRRTWVGEWTWTPQYGKRTILTELLMDDRLAPARARELVSSTGARFALTDCRAPAPLGRSLGPLVVSKRTFGCAAVYELRPR